MKQYERVEVAHRRLKNAKKVPQIKRRKKKGKLTKRKCDKKRRMGKGENVEEISCEKGNQENKQCVVKVKARSVTEEWIKQ